MPAPTATAERAAASPRRTDILGRIDIADVGRVSGWAWDQGRPEHRLEVEIWLGDQRLGSTVADRERADLKRNGIGDGGHAFQFKLDPPVSATDLPQVTARVVIPELAEPVPLFRPSETQTVVERTVLLPFARLHKTLDAIAERQLRLARACELLREEQTKGPAQESALLQRLLSSQGQIEARLRELDVFQARFDETLRSLSEQNSGGGGEGERTLRRAVTVLAGTTLISSCTVVLLLLRPLLG